MEVECALLEGEQGSEMAQLQREKELLDQLKQKIHSSEKKSHTEKSQVIRIYITSHLCWFVLSFSRKRYMRECFIRIECVDTQRR